MSEKCPCPKCGTAASMNQTSTVLDWWDCESYRGEKTGFVQSYKCLERQRDALQAIVDTYPKTEDNEPITPGMTTYCDDPISFARTWDIRLRTGQTFDEHAQRSNELQFSTHKAARAAMKK